MVATKQAACAFNNALWCNAVLKAAGAKTKYDSDFWHAEGKQLPLYPNIVTLSATPGATLRTALLELPAGSAVKDCYDRLDLERDGFQKLFSGTWLFRPASVTGRPPASSSWQKITHPVGLKKWLAAWNNNESLHNLFPSRLLELGAVSFAAIANGDEFKAGAVFNSGPEFGSSEVLGLSNVFCRRNWLYSALRDLLQPFPHKSIATYETDAEVIPVYRQLGFEECGQLGVWLKN
ncbi:MAG: hypothetical protein AAGA50_25505 [Pseudomonadota bacterium]